MAPGRAPCATCAQDAAHYLGCPHLVATASFLGLGSNMPVLALMRFAAADTSKGARAGWALAEDMWMFLYLSIKGGLRSMPTRPEAPTAVSQPPTLPTGPPDPNVATVCLDGPGTMPPTQSVRITHFGTFSACIAVD